MTWLNKDVVNIVFYKNEVLHLLHADYYRLLFVFCI